MVRILPVAVALVWLSGCATHGGIVFEDDAGAVTVAVDKRGHHHHAAPPKIPPGHRPPAGSCRIWYEGKPPGQQPPPGDCRELSRHVPPNAWLIEG